MLAVREAIQRSLRKLGCAPVYHETDNSTVATYHLNGQAEVAGEERMYHPLYLELLRYYGMQPRRTHVSSPDENGDVKASNGGLKRALRQQLLLQGRHDFAAVAEYEAFVYGVMEQRNRPQRVPGQVRLQEEVAVMKRITDAALANYRERRLKVSAGSLILIQTNLYSVPTSLSGQTVTVHQYEWDVEVYYQQQLIQILRLAAQEMECEVATALTRLLEPGVRFDEGDVAAFVQTKTTIGIGLSSSVVRPSSTIP